MNDKKRHSILSNTFFAISWQFRVAPIYTIFTLCQRVLDEVTVLFKHTFLIAYIIHCVEKSLGLMKILYFLIPIAFLVIYKECVNCIWTAYIEPKFQAKMKKAVHLKLYEKAVSMEISKYDNSEFYNDFVWAMQKATSHLMDIWWTFVTLVCGIIVALIAGGYVVSQDKMAIVVSIIIVIGTYVTEYLINRLKMKREEDMLPVRRKRDYVNRVFYLIDFVKDLKMSTMAEKLEKDFDETSHQMEDLVQKHGPKISIMAVTRESMQYVVHSGFYLTYLFYHALVKGMYGLGSLLAIYNSTNQFGNKLTRIIKILPQFQQHSLYIEKIRTFLETKNVMVDDGILAVPDAGDIILENVKFTYPGNEHPTINGVSMKIKQGEKIALVGFNGAGKSTLVKLLLRLYDVDSGHIQFGTHDICEYPITEYRKRFGVLFQDFEIIATDVKHNITMSDEAFDEKLADAILTKVAFEEKFQTLPNGYDTQLTKEFDDNGINLSGGEAQKIALARVLYADVNVIVLDEPSSALDPIAEYQLNKTITELAEEKTVIIISHRLSTTRFVDHIYMMENGKIVEQGSHEILMKLNGKYAEMFELQAEKYR